MSLSGLLATQRDATEAVESRARRHSLSTTQFEGLRAALRADSYLFTRVICKHKDLVPELHMPLSYLVTGSTAKLVEVIDGEGWDSYVTRKIREELWAREINWRTPSGYQALDALIEFVNVRWFRGAFKSSVCTHGAPTFIATNDPNETIKITHAVDEKAWQFVEQIGATLLSGTYRDFFPERIPADISRAVTMKRIEFGGRTISHPQTTIQGAGYISKEEGAHYSIFITDDLVNEGNSSAEPLKGVRKWQQGLPGFYMNTRRIRRVEVGTKHDEDDDDAFLTRGKLASQCLTIRVPIEEHPQGKVVNILERGTPTIPQLYTKEKIQKLQDSILSSDEETDGAASWRCNYLLDAYAGGVRLFPPHLVDDKENWWKGPWEHPKEGPRKLGHFLVQRYNRDAEGHPVDKDGKPLVTAAGELLDDWTRRAKRLLFDPWKDLDRIATVDPSWAEGGDNWSIECEGIDYDAVRFQLSNRSDTNGMDGWIENLVDLDDYYHFRVIGFDSGAYQDKFIQNLMKTDKRLRKLKSRMVPVPHRGVAKLSRIRAGVAEPLSMHRLLLDPTETGTPTRDEMKSYKGGKNAVDGRLDAIAMAPTVMRRRRSDEEKKKGAEKRALDEMQQNRRIDPALGVPLAA